jgi:hypothetical protein
MNLIDVDPIIFQSPEESFNPHIVQALTFAVHADPDAVLLEQRAVVWIGELAPLIAVDDFRLVATQGALQAVQDERFIKGAGQLVVNDVPAEPIDDDKQIHEAFGHRDIGDVDSPNLVGFRDRQVPEQIGFQELGMLSFAQIRLGKQRVNAHFCHDPPRPLLIDENPMIASQDGCVVR